MIRLRINSDYGWQGMPQFAGLPRSVDVTPVFRTGASTKVGASSREGEAPAEPMTSGRSASAGGIVLGLRRTPTCGRIWLSRSFALPILTMIDALVPTAKFVCNHVAFVIACVVLLAGCQGAQPGESDPAQNANQVLERVTEKGPVKLSVRIKPSEPRLSDLVEMEVEVTAQPNVEIKPPEFGQAVGDFLVRDYSEGSVGQQSKLPGADNSRKFRYQLEPVHAGRHLIRSVAMEFIDNRPDSEAKGKSAWIESDPIEVQVTSELGDQVPNLADLEPMLPPRPLASSLQGMWWMIATGVGFLVGLAIWLRRRRKSSLPVVRQKTPEEIAHAALTALLSENLPVQGLFKEFYLRLTGIVRHYIEGTTGLRAPEQTTEEFLRAIRSRDIFPVERSNRLIEFLEAADMVKYAGQEPNADQIELSISRAREFVDLRGPIATPPDGAPRVVPLQSDRGA